MKGMSNHIPFVVVAAVALLFHSIYLFFGFLVVSGALLAKASTNPPKKNKRSKKSKRALPPGEDVVELDTVRLNTVEPEELSEPEDPPILSEAQKSSPVEKRATREVAQVAQVAQVEPEREFAKETVTLKEPSSSGEKRAESPLFNNVSTLYSDESGTRLEFEVPDEFHHLIIGKGGSVIKDIQGKTKTTINLPEKGGPSNVVVQGTLGEKEKDEENCQAARQIIYDIINDFLHKRAAEDAKRERDYLMKKEEEERISQETGKKYQAQQENVDILAAERSRLFELSQKAFEDGDKQKAKDFSEEAKALSAEIEKAKEIACETLFLDRNPNGLNSESVDLHGLQVQFALQKVEQYLAAAKERGLADVGVITGAGNHSEGGVAKIKPEVEKFLTSQGYSFEPEKNGSFRVTL